MNYPTMDEVSTADVEQLAEWYRFLPSPGISITERNPPPTIVEFNQRLEAESRILDYILNRLESLGGMTADVSRKIGWRPR